MRVGITDYAQEALGDIVFVTLPDVGSDVTAGSTCGEVESTKSVTDIYAPVTGTVVARNESLDAAPELVNTDPYGDGWMVEIRPADGAGARRACSTPRPTRPASTRPDRGRCRPGRCRLAAIAVALASRSLLRCQANRLTLVRHGP